MTTPNPPLDRSSRSTMTSSKQFVFPSNKSGLLQGGRIASVIKELQGTELDSTRDTADLYKSMTYKNSKNIFIHKEANSNKESVYNRNIAVEPVYTKNKGGDTVYTKNKGGDTVHNNSNSFSRARDSFLYNNRESGGLEIQDKTIDSPCSSSCGISSKSNTPRSLVPPGSYSTGSSSSSTRSTPPPPSTASRDTKGTPPPQARTSREPIYSVPHCRKTSLPLPTAEYTSREISRSFDRMKLSPTFARKSGQSHLVSISMKEGTEVYSDTEDESTRSPSEIPQTKYINPGGGSSPPSPETDTGRGETSDNVSLDLSMSFSESDSEPEPARYTLQRDTSVKSEINRLKSRFPPEQRKPVLPRQSSLYKPVSSRQGQLTTSTGSTLSNTSESSSPAKQSSVGPASPRYSLTHQPNPVTEYTTEPVSPRYISVSTPGIESSQQNITSCKPGGYVGFASLPDQVYRRAVRKGFEFSLMVVGESGLGKSTLVNSMFLTDIYQSAFNSEIQRTIEVEPHTVLLEEGGVKLSLTVVDTPGFGDSVDNTDCWVPVISYIEDQFDKFLEAEQRVNRIQLVDTRVHACLYFIAPSGHGLRQLDIQTMKRLHDKVNIVPVIGKSDSCTQQEIQRFKSTILRQLKENSINVYDFPPTDDREVDWMREKLPFAVVGSNTITQTPEGKKMRCREYPWGTVNIEDKTHCDFTAMRTLLLSHHMQDLKDVTNSVHYEAYRCRKLTDLMGERRMESHPLCEIEKDGLQHRVKVDKMEEEMEQVFRKKVEEKEEKMRRQEEQEEQEMELENRRVQKLREELSKDTETFNRERSSWQNNTRQFNFRSVRSEESLTGRKKKYGLDRVIPFKFGRT